MTDTERLDFMLNYWGKFDGGATTWNGRGERVTEARILWTGFDSYGREAEFITAATDPREAIDLAAREAEEIRGEDWSTQHKDYLWALAPIRRPRRLTPYEKHVRATSPFAASSSAVAKRGGTNSPVNSGEAEE